MILTRKEISEEMKKGRIKITPFKRSQLGPASIDLSLDNKFRIFDLGHEMAIDENTDYRDMSRFITIKKPLSLNPGGFVLGITKERIALPEDICGWLSGRSRFARLGLLVHITANFVQPGINNKQVLEIYNASPNIVKLKPGTRVIQLILQRTESKAKYHGKFQNQRNV